MRHVLLCAAILLVSSVVTTSTAQENSAAPAQAKPETEVPLKAIERFDGKTSFRTKGGKSQELHVVIQNWEIHGRQRIQKFPEAGFMVVQLHSGKVTTVISGKEEKRSGGAFWTVPAGSSMSVQVDSESALLQIMAVRP